MKAILVVDVNMTQDNKHICEDDEQHCLLWNKDIKFCMYNFNNNTKGCPLKPLPQKRILPKEMVEGTNYGEEPWFSDGFNACIDEILGEIDDRDI